MTSLSDLTSLSNSPQNIRDNSRYLAFPLQLQVINAKIDWATQMTNIIFFSRESVFQFMWDKLVFKLVMLVGNFIVWNMVSNLMDKCQVTKPLVEAMIRLIPSLAKLELESMYPELSLLI